MGFFQNTPVENDVEDTVFEIEGDDIEEVLSGETKKSNTATAEIPVDNKISAETKEKSKKELDKLASTAPKRDVTMVIPEGIILPNGIEVDGDVCIRSNSVKQVSASNIMLDCSKANISEIKAENVVSIEKDTCITTGAIECTSITIKGAVSGNIQTDNFTMEDNAVFKGNVSTKHINISDSANISGTITILPIDESAFEVFE